MLRAKQPQTIQKRLKALFYGNAGAGKTTAAIQFPKPYLIDTEKGAEHQQYVDMLSKKGGVIFQTSSFDEVVKEIRALLTEDHEYKTLIIDPMTTIFDSLVDECTREIVSKSKDPTIDGSEYGRNVTMAGNKMKVLCNLLIRLDMNIIITTHAKNEYIAGKSTNQQTFDAYKKLDYIFDLVIEIQKRNKKRYGIVKKSRIKSFEDLEIFEFSYDEVAKRYGREIIEKSAEKEILATSDQVESLDHYVDLLKVDDKTTGKWLAKASASSFEEMETTKIQACIDFMKAKIEEK